MYAITGATGNVGRRIAEKLLAAGQKVRVIGRSADRLEPLAAKGAEPFVASPDDAAAMTRAFTGAQAVYAMIPPHLDAADLRAYQNRVSEALATAIAHAGVRYVVNLSSVGAQLTGGVGPVNGLHDAEDRLNRLEGVNVLHLRPGYFMENLLWMKGPIRQLGVAGSPLRADLPITMIATRDIADQAAQHLLRLDFSGKSVRELLGQRDVTMNEAVRALGQAIGKPDLSYVQVSYEEAEQAMRANGVSPGTAHLFSEMSRSMNEGIMRPTERRLPQNTTATSIETFAGEVFAPALRG